MSVRRAWLAIGFALGIVVTGGIGLAHRDLVLEPQMERMRVRELELRRLLKESQRLTNKSQQQPDAALKPALENAEKAVGWLRRWQALDHADQLHQTYLRHLHHAGLVPKITHEPR